MRPSESDIRRSRPTRNDSRSSSHPLTTTYKKSRMPSLFNAVRGGIYTAALLFTIICLAMAGHFEQVLASSDLTRFVPFAIFVCSASLLIIILLLGFSLWLRERNPISTRIELASLALAGIFWLVLGVYLATSESQAADVECFASATSTEPLDDSSASFHTEQYQAMYRVLNAFSLVNASLLLIFCLGLFFLALRRHRKGDEHMWYGPVTSCAWFNEYSKRSKSKKNSRSGILPTERSQRYTHQPSRSHSSRRERTQTTNYPAKVYQSQMREKPQTRQVGDSANSLLTSTSESFDNGGMKNPGRTGRR